MEVTDKVEIAKRMNSFFGIVGHNVSTSPQALVRGSFL